MIVQAWTGAGSAAGHTSAEEGLDCDKKFRTARPGRQAADMKYYVFQVRALQEEKCLARARELAADRPVEFSWPRRELRIRKAGRWRETVAPIFPGYIFISSAEPPSSLYRLVKSVPGFIRFLKSNTAITPLEGRDLDLVRHFLRQGEIVKKSLVTFEADQRIRVLEGPLKGLEGMIIKVDKRKKRIKVRLALYTNSFSIDFGYDDLGAAGTGG
jgi:transcriptional antiterminator NusG